MALSTPPHQSTETVIESRLVVQQQLTPPRTPPAQGEAAGTPMSPNPTPAANPAASAVSSQFISTTELKTSKGKTIVLKQGGQLYETPKDSDDCNLAQG